MRSWFCRLLAVQLHRHRYFARTEIRERLPRDKSWWTQSRFFRIRLRLVWRDIRFLRARRRRILPIAGRFGELPRGLRRELRHPIPPTGPLVSVREKLL